jgi:hypothetical protein
MKLFNKSPLPNAVATWLSLIFSRFTYLQENQPILLLDYFVTPVGGDTSYIVFQQGDRLYILVTTDHPDPLYQKDELKRLSKKYVFSKLQSPNGKIVDLSDALKDGSEDSFFTKVDATYYYTALAKNL